MNKHGLFLMASAMLLLVGCGGGSASRELVDARVAYERAQEAGAGRVAPVELHAARTALASAESAHDNESAEVARDLAYVAHRRAELAGSRARMMIAIRRREQIEAQREALETRLHRRTARTLAQTREQLEAERRQLAERQRQLEAERQARAQTTTELQTERQARQEAERQLSAAMRSLQEIASVREEQRGVVITLSGEVLFAPGQSTLLEVAQQRLGQVAAAIIDQGGTQEIIVEGHTDSRGSSSDNQLLSQARAEAVRSYLVSRGVPAARVRAIGMGESRPIGDNDTPDGRATNRRVEIIIGNPPGRR